GMYGTSKRENREIPRLARRVIAGGAAQGTREAVSLKQVDKARRRVSATSGPVSATVSVNPVARVGEVGGCAPKRSGPLCKVIA
ncbi:hypothetical protein, partial [Mycobacterium sp.]|uniref:hypothetical protein n=1 Tax=Mycobacterium sp. TaxID=1785 RepID=UPI003C772437